MLSITGNNGFAIIRRLGYASKITLYPVSFSALSAAGVLTEITRNTSGAMADLARIMDYISGKT